MSAKKSAKKSKKKSKASKAQQGQGRGVKPSIFSNDESSLPDIEEPAPSLEEIIAAAAEEVTNAVSGWNVAWRASCTWSKALANSVTRHRVLSVHGQDVLPSEPNGNIPLDAVLGANADRFFMQMEAALEALQSLEDASSRAADAHQAALWSYNTAWKEYTEYPELSKEKRLLPEDWNGLFRALQWMEVMSSALSLESGLRRELLHVLPRLLEEPEQSATMNWEKSWATTSYIDWDVAAVLHAATAARIHGRGVARAFRSAPPPVLLLPPRRLPWTTASSR